MYNSKRDNTTTSATLRSAKSCRITVGAAVCITLCATAHAQQQSTPGSEMMGEVLVTAQKRVENVKDVPVPVTVLAADQLADNGQVLLRDYTTAVPGLNFTPGLATNAQISLRGITTGGDSNPTVGILVDDVPFGGSTSRTGGSQIPDIDPGDLARIEVLRGPQGTLYGANSMGGLIKYVTLDPSTDGYSGRIEAGTSGVQNGAQPGYNLRASANLPLSDTAALRVSGFTRQDPGYINNPALLTNGVNETQTYGARASALWHPTDNFTVKLSALLQNTKSNGSSESTVQPGLNSLDQNYIAHSGDFGRNVKVYSATAKYDAGSFNVISITGYNSNSYHANVDFTPVLGKLTQSVFGVSGTPAYEVAHIDKVTQEIRLASASGQKLEWLLGGFYTHEFIPDIQYIWAQDPSGRVVDQWFYERVPYTYSEYAAFADLTYHFTDRFDVQIGARESHATLTNDTSIETGPFVPLIVGVDDPYVIQQYGSKENTFTYLLTPRLKLTPDIMLYARIASGYRPGGPNSSAPGAPLSFASDKTDNYELGIKGDFIDHALTVDASVYYINWKDIQIQLRTPAGITYQTNGAKAKSEGVELSFTAHPVTGLSASAWFTYDDAVLTEDFPSNSTAFGKDGDRLPDTTRFSGNISLQQDFALSDHSTAFVAGVASYIGDRKSTFTSSALRQTFPSYTKMDLRMGVRYDSWTANLYVNNIADTRGVLSGGIGYTIPYAFTYIQPRTIGLSLVKTF